MAQQTARKTAKQPSQRTPVDEVVHERVRQLHAPPRREREAAVERPPPKPTYRFAGELPAALAYLRDERRWVAWKYVLKQNDAKWTKPPINPHTGKFGSSTDPEAWGTFDEALAAVKRYRLAGVGLVMTGEDGMVGGDLDHCVNDAGMFTPLAAAIVGLAETYAEYSPSAEGLRFLLTGKLVKALKNDAVGVEVYSTGRYLTITGNKLDEAPDEIRDAPQTLAFLSAAARPKKASAAANGQTAYRPKSDDAERIREALRHIPADARETWLRMGMAVKSELGDAGFGLWREWALSSVKWDEVDGRRVWYSIAPEGGITIATLFGLARENGWVEARPAERSASAMGHLKPRRARARAASETPQSEEGTDQSKPVIRRIGGNLPQCTDEAEAHLLAAGVQFYQRGKELVRPYNYPALASNKRKTTVVGVMPVTAVHARDVMGRQINWERWNTRRERWVLSDADKEVAETLLDRVGAWRFPQLVGVLATPTLRPDGSLLAQPGYDESTQFLLIEPPPVSVPERPTMQDAQRALALLEGLLTEFPFVDACSKSVALSALITPVCRGAMSVPPLHAFSATAPGSGKSYLADLAAGIAVGQACKILSVGGCEEKEIEKRLHACVLEGNPLFSLDNVNGELGGDFLCQLVERPSLSPRILGRSKQPSIPNTFTPFANGNGLHVRGDMVRRTIMGRLDAGIEQPEMRTFKDRPFEKILANRSAYISAALTIVRAYIVARRPDRPPAFNSYEEWSDTVRGGLMWLGRADPVDSITVARANDPVLQTLGAMLEAWEAAIGSGPGNASTAAEVLTVVDEVEVPGGAYIHPQLREALELTGITTRAKRAPTLALGKWLQNAAGRICGGRKFEHLPQLNNSHRPLRWFVARARG